MTQTSDYQKAYESARKELSDLLAQQEKIEKRLVLVRKSLQTFAELCEGEGIEIEPSAEAAYLLENATLADEVRVVLGANYDRGFRPSEIKDELERLGHDLSQYQNPQSTIHMVLKRMAGSNEIQEEKDKDGKSVYQMEHPLRRAIGRFSRQIGVPIDMDPDKLPPHVSAAIYGPAKSALADVRAERPKSAAKKK